MTGQQIIFMVIVQERLIWDWNLKESLTLQHLATWLWGFSVSFSMCCPLYLGASLYFERMDGSPPATHQAPYRKPTSNPSAMTAGIYGLTACLDECSEHCVCRQYMELSDELTSVVGTLFSLFSPDLKPCGKSCVLVWRGSMCAILFLTLLLSTCAVEVPYLILLEMCALITSGLSQ